MSLGSRLRELREHADMSQTEVAKKLHIANSTLSQYESGVRVPSDDVKSQLADLYGVSVDYLLGRSNERSPKKNPLTEQWQGDLMKTLEAIGALEPTGGLNEKGRDVITEFLRSNAAVLKKLIDEGE